MANGSKSEQNLKDAFAGEAQANRRYLAFAQQNGITAMILALLFETELPETVGIVAPAILFINLGYYLVNRMLPKP